MSTLNLLSATALVIAPYIAYQFWGFWVFCIANPNPRPWCFDKVPHLYSFVQKEYWNQGFLNYWQVKQIPNFLVAAPLTVLTFYACFLYFKAFVNHSNIMKISKSEKMANQTTNDPTQFFFSVRLLPFMLYWMGFVLLILFNFHVQTMGRMLTSTLPFYWFLAFVLLNRSKFHSIFFKSIFLYGLIWSVVGTVLFSNFYPWT